MKTQYAAINMHQIRVYHLTAFFLLFVKKEEECDSEINSTCKTTFCNKSKSLKLKTEYLNSIADERTSRFSL